MSVGTLNDMTPEALRDLAKRAEETARQKEAKAKQDQEQWVVVPAVASSYAKEYRFNKRTFKLQFRTALFEDWRESGMAAPFKALGDTFTNEKDLLNFAAVVSAYARTKR